MSWSYDAKTKLAGTQADAPVRRVHVEDAIVRLADAGIRSRPLLVSLITALSGLSSKEVAFTVDLVFGKEAL